MKTIIKDVSEDNNLLFDDEYIISIIKNVLEQFYEKDLNLFSYSKYVHEQAISFRIAHYLAKIFKYYDVDCEYNKNIDKYKEIDGGKIRPDIIVHKRGNNENNLLFIEVKKDNGLYGAIDSNHAREKYGLLKKDIKKLKYSMRVYNYKYAVEIIVSNDDKKRLCCIFNKNNIIYHNYDSEFYRIIEENFLL